MVAMFILLCIYRPDSVSYARETRHWGVGAFQAKSLLRFQKKMGYCVDAESKLLPLAFIKHEEKRKETKKKHYKEIG